MSIEALRAKIRHSRMEILDISQEQAAEQAGVSLVTWKNLEQPGNTRRTGIRIPQDLELMDKVARVIGFESGMALMKEVGLL